MGKNKRYLYYVEGGCERKLINELKVNNQMVIPGKVEILNVKQELITLMRIRSISNNTIVILVVDTDVGDAKILTENIKTLKRYSNIVEVWCVLQVKNLEDELLRSTDVKIIKNLIGCASNKEFKPCFIKEKNLMRKLEEHHFEIEKMWMQPGDKKYKSIANDGWRIKK